MSVSSSHILVPVTPNLTLHALMRSGTVDPCFSIREIDMKLLRHGTVKKRTSMTSATAQLNEQAARVKARQLMLSYAPHLLEASKEEIRWLKERGVLGKRAPKSSLMSATFLLSLLREQGKEVLAAHLQNALVHCRLGLWSKAPQVEISAADAAAELEAQRITAEEQAREDERAAAEERAAAAGMEEGEELMDDSMETVVGAHSTVESDMGVGMPSPTSASDSRPRRRASVSKRKSSISHSSRADDYDDADDVDGNEEEAAVEAVDAEAMKKRKRNRRSVAAHHTPSSARGYSTTHTPMSASINVSHSSSSSLGLSPLSLNGSPTRPQSASREPAHLSVSKAILMVNPRDRAPTAAPLRHVHFGADRTPNMLIVDSDGCTIAAPPHQAATARASHGITNGSWYIEVMGSDVALDMVRRHLSSAPLSSAPSSSNPLVDDSPPHCRIGFATAHAQIRNGIGHDQYSYAYGDRYGDKIHEGEAAEYGLPFTIFQFDESTDAAGRTMPLGPGDVIGMLIELGVSDGVYDGISVSNDGGSPALTTGNRLSFYRNGECQGIAWADLRPDQVWYPAVSLSNGMAVTFNFRVNMTQAQTPVAAAGNMSHMNDAHPLPSSSYAHPTASGVNAYRTPGSSSYHPSSHQHGSYAMHATNHMYANNNSGGTSSLDRKPIHLPQANSTYSSSSNTQLLQTPSQRSVSSRLFSDSSPRMPVILQSPSLPLTDEDRTTTFGLSSALTMPTGQITSISPAAYANGMPGVIQRSLRVPSEEDASLPISAIQSRNGVSSLLQSSPSASPFPMSLLFSSPAASPTPLIHSDSQVNMSVPSAIGYSLSTTPLPMLPNDSNPLGYGNSTLSASSPMALGE